MERYKQLIEIVTDLFGGRMEETKELITTDDIRSKVYIIRGQQVMLDKDLAEIYGYEVKKLNQQVKRKKDIVTVLQKIDYVGVCLGGLSSLFYADSRLS